MGSVTGSYGVLVDRVARDADGFVMELRYGDGAKTTGRLGHLTAKYEDAGNLTQFLLKIEGKL